MKKLFLVLALISCAAMAFGQTGKLKVVVYDSTTKTPLELATVSVFSMDSSLITYQLADKNGAASFDKLPLKNKVVVSISYVGYSTYSSHLQLTGKDSLHVLLALSSQDSSSVTVTSRVPVRMNGDTLEINPAAFKMKAHQVVEELLSQVPGMTVWSDGSITVSGRKVQNVFVDGKPFAGSTDPRIATQNLPKSAIDKIQLYQEYDRENIGNPGRQQADSILSMNIKLKETAKKGYFGKGGAGYGTDDRFEADLVMQTYDKKTTMGIGGGYNNINKDIGSFEQLLQSNTYRTTNPDLSRVGRFGPGGINKNYAAGISFTRDFSEAENSRQANRLLVNYNKNGGDTWVTNQRTQSRATAGSEQLIREEGQQNNTNSGHSVSVNYLRNNSYNDNLNLSGSAGFQNRLGISSSHTETADAQGTLQSTNDINSRQSDRSDNQYLSLNFRRNDFDRPLTNLSLSANMQRSNSSSERNVLSVFRSMTVNNKDTAYNRRYLNNSQNVSARVNLSYTGIRRLLFGRYNLGGVDLRLEQTFNYSQINGSAVVSDFDSSAKNYKPNQNLTNENDRKTSSYLSALAVTKSFSKNRSGTFRNLTLQTKLMEDLRSETNVSTIAWRNLDRQFHFFRYEAGLNYYTFDRRKNNYNASVYYNKNFDYPSIDALYTIVDDINAYNITVGNPALKNRVNHNLNLSGNFNTQNQQSPYAVSANISTGYNLSENAVTDSVINAPSGKRTSYFINADRSRDLYLSYNMNVSKRMKKNTLQLMYNGSLNASSQPNYIDGIYNVSKSSRLSNQLSLRLSLGAILVASIAERLEYNQVRQHVTSLNNFANSSNTTNISVNLNYPDNVSFGTTLDHVNNSSLDKPSFLWNAFLTCRVMKQQGELKLSAMDILKQYRNIFNSVSAYGTSTSITNGLQQYFMVTFAYYPRKFGKRAGEDRDD